MIEYEAKLRNWGNSIGIVIPKEEIEKEKLQPNQKVKVLISPINPVRVKDIFGKIKFKTSPPQSTEEILREIDKELDTKF